MGHLVYIAVLPAERHTPWAACYVFTVSLHSDANEDDYNNDSERRTARLLTGLFTSLFVVSGKVARSVGRLYLIIVRIVVVQVVATACAGIVRRCCCCCCTVQVHHVLFPSTGRSDADDDGDDDVDG